jgi:aromatic ring-opening dioxygenase catalytic subunit (LigB family)
MGKLVALFAMSHAPGQTGFPDSAPALKKANVYAAWSELRKRFEAAEPDVLVGISNDHFQNFHRVQPPFCVGTAESYILPREAYAKTLRLTPHAVKGAGDFAESLLEISTDYGVDLSFAEELELQDEFSVPKHFLDPTDKVPLVPILTNCLNRGQPPPKRFYELGKAMAATIKTRPERERIAVIATGGLSHDPTGPNWCLIDEEFDRRFLELFATGDAEKLFSEFTLEKIFAPGKGGTPEMLNWFTALGAAPTGSKAEILAYEPVYEWATGMGYVAWNDL